MIEPTQNTVQIYRDRAIKIIEGLRATVATTDNEAELDSGVWFLCRANVGFLGEAIVRFVRQVQHEA